MTGSTGCETDLQWDAEHCGACNAACEGGKTCQAGTCACPAGEAAAHGNVGIVIVPVWCPAVAAVCWAALCDDDETPLSCYTMQACTSAVSSAFLRTAAARPTMAASANPVSMARALLFQTFTPDSCALPLHFCSAAHACMQACSCAVRMLPLGSAPTCSRTAATAGAVEQRALAAQTAKLEHVLALQVKAAGLLDEALALVPCVRLPQHALDAVAVCLLPVRLQSFFLNLWG